MFGVRSPAWRGASAAALLAAGLVAAGEARGEIGDLFKNFGGFFGQDQATTPGTRPRDEEIPCPAIEVQSGNETLTVRANAKSTEPSAVRHQLSLSQTARECWLENGFVRLKVGAAGRVVLGPAGSPGTYAVPIRIAVTRGAKDTVFAKAGRANVTVPPGESSALFTYVDENVAFRLPEGDRSTNYVIHVGLDSQPEKSAKPAPRRR